MPRRQFRRVLVFASVLLLSACARNAAPASAPTPFAELRQTWEAAFNRADTAALVALYAPDAVLIPPSGTVLTGGQAAARANLGGLMEDRTLGLSLIHQRSTANVGHIQGTWQARRKGGEERRLIASGTYLMLFERAPDGRWSIAYHAWRQDAEPAPNRSDVPPRR